MNNTSVANDGNFAAFLMNLNRISIQTPNQITLKILKQTLDRIKKDTEVPKEHFLDILFAVQNIVGYCFDDNVHAKDILKLCSKIFFILRKKTNANIPKTECEKNPLQKPTLSDLFVIEPSPKFNCNYDDPCILATEFPALNTKPIPQAPAKDVNPKQEQQSFDDAVTLEEVRGAINDIIAKYRSKWDKERSAGYLSLGQHSSSTKNAMETLPKYEEYILNVLESKWNNFEKAADRMKNKKKLTDGLISILDLFNQLQLNFNNEDCNSQAILLNNSVQTDGITATLKDELDLVETFSRGNIIADDFDFISTKSSLSTSTDSLQNVGETEIKENDNPETISIASIKQQEEPVVQNLYINENYVETEDSQNETPQDTVKFTNSINKSPEIEEALKRRNILRSFAIEFKSGVENKPASRLISIGNTHNCYIDFNRIWNDSSRWMEVKYKLLQKGVINSTGFYLCLPIYRHEFTISSGSFGSVEIGFSKSFKAIAIRRLTELGWAPERCDELQATLRKLSKVQHCNLLISHIIQDLCGYSFFYTKLCDYNLEEYISKMKETKQFTECMAKNISFQIVKGLAALHRYSPSIIHGNLKPSNVFIDEDGVLKLAEFGIHKYLPITSDIVSVKSRIWWPSECHVWYKYMKNYYCTSMSDIQACGILLHLVNSGGLHPYGNTHEEIVHNLEMCSANIRVESLELWGLLFMMFYPDPCQRPNIVEVVNHVFFWENEKKWDFIKTCLAISNTEYEPLSCTNSVANKFCSAFEKNWTTDSTKFFWVNLACEHFPGINVPTGARADSVLGLLKFLNKCRHENQVLFNKPGLVLKIYPDLPSLIYNALRGSEWFEWKDLKKFNPFVASSD